MAAATPVPWPGLVAFAVALGLERGLELRLDADHRRPLLARGGVLFAADPSAAIVAFHGLYPIATVAEVVGLGARPTPAWPAYLLVCVLTETLRLAAMRALGERWTTRVVVVPGAPPIRSGLYRWLRHPNYLAV